MDSSDTPTPVDGSTPTSTAQESASEPKTRRKTDIAWAYCTHITQGGKKKIKCMYCDMVCGRFNLTGSKQSNRFLAVEPMNQ